MVFSQFANRLVCPYCSVKNVAEEWPENGDNAAFYNQTRLRTEEEPGEYRVNVHCPSCSEDWFVVWDRDPT